MKLNPNKFSHEAVMWPKQEHTKFLYRLLQERPDGANISHKNMPTYDQHVEFVKKMPYSIWYVMKYQSDLVGSIYLTLRREIGVFISKPWQRQGIAEYSVQWLMKTHGPGSYLANVAPDNQPSHALFAKLGGKVIQHTYELSMPC